MSVVMAPSEDELYLLAILTDSSGLDIAEFAWNDPESTDGCYRAWDFQWPWYTCMDEKQVDQGGRALGKTVSIQMRACAFPFAFPGQDMLVTAPELNHLSPLTGAIESRILGSRLLREMLPETKGHGVTRNPHWQMKFKNNAMIVSRLPNKDGKGVKGQHVIQIELDEAQDYPLAGWIEIGECLNSGLPGAAFRCHGVPKGVRDRFFEITKPSTEWTVHRPMAFMRPNWNDSEREKRVDSYGGSRQNIDYKRNIYGEHGDASNSVFVLSRLMSCVDQDDASEYNTNVYWSDHVQFEQYPSYLANDTDDPAELEFLKGQREDYLKMRIDLPGTHLNGWHQTVNGKEVGAPRGYSAYYGGMDVGVTNHPSEILVFGQRQGSDQIDLLTRINLQRINTDDQKAVIEHVFDFYGGKLLAFTLDKTGVGFPIWDQLTRRAIKNRLFGINFSEKVVIGFEDRELEKDEKQEDLAILRNVVEATTDWLRNDYVDTKKILLPNDKELIIEFQGQTYTVVKDNGTPYGTRKQFSGGSFHTLDAAKMVMGAKYLPNLNEQLLRVQPQTPVLDVFFDGYS